MAFSEQMRMQYVHRSSQDLNLCSYATLKYILPEITCPLSDTLINNRKTFQNTLTLLKHDHIGNLVFCSGEHYAHINMQIVVALRNNRCFRYSFAPSDTGIDFAYVQWCPAIA